MTALRELSGRVSDTRVSDTRVSDTRVSDTRAEHRISSECWGRIHPPLP